MAEFIGLCAEEFMKKNSVINKISYKHEYDPEKLDKYLSPIDVWSIAFGFIIGWGAFVMPGTDFLPMAGPLGTFIAMIIGACLMLVIGKNYAYLMQKFPGTGGVYTYTKAAFGRDHAFISSWFLTLSYISVVFLNATALFVICRTVFGDLLQVGFHYKVTGNEIYTGELLLSVAALVIIGALLVFQKKLLHIAQTTLAILLFVGTLILFIAAIPHFKAENILDFTVGSSFNHFNAVMILVLLAPWAYVGFDVASLETAHFKFPVKKSGRTIALSIICGAFVYIAMTVISVSVIPPEFSSWKEYIANLNSQTGINGVTTFFAADSMLGKAGLIIVSIAALAAIFTGIIGAYRATSRILTTMAEDKIISKKFLIGSFSIVFIMIISILISFLGRNALIWFVELTSLCAVIGFGYTSASAFKIARDEKNKTVQLTGVIGLIVSLVFGAVLLMSKVQTVSTMSAQSFLFLAVWCLIGFMFYWRTMRQSSLEDFNGISTSSTVLFCLLFYSTLMWYAKKIISIEDSADFRSGVIKYTVVMMVVVALGLAVMLFVQTTLRNKHQSLQIEMIRAEESSKAKSQFLFNMTHDIRTPMNAIVGYSHLAKQEKNIPPKIEEYIDKIDFSSKHLLSLINDILDMGQIESGKLELNNEPCDICETVISAYDIFKDQMREKNINYTCDIEDVNDRWAEFDSNRLIRAILNFLSNAHKFTPEGGSVSLQLRQKASDDESIGLYELTVSDSGIGMTDEFAAKVFEVFARERSSTVSRIEGTGLGMAITKGIVEAMDGTIDVVTAPGEGTKFTVTLPLKLADEIVSEEKEKDEHIDLSGVKVLLVEDNEINSEIAVMILSHSGCVVETAENGLVAVNIIKEAPADAFDIVLMDIQMPVMDGYTATAEIRALDDEKKADIPIVAMTANAFKEDEKAAFDAGMQAYIAKPLDVGQMLKTISGIINANSKGAN